MTEECRICYETEGKFVSPCKCAGSMKYVHQTCLTAWRAYSDQYSACPVCMTRYNDGRKLLEYENNVHLEDYFIDGSTSFKLILATIAAVLLGPIPKGKHATTSVVGCLSIIYHALFASYCFIKYMILLKAVKHRRLYFGYAAKYLWLPVIHGALLYYLSDDPLVFILPHTIGSQMYLNYHMDIIYKINVIVYNNNTAPIHYMHGRRIGE